MQEIGTKMHSRRTFYCIYSTFIISLRFQKNILRYYETNLHFMAVALNYLINA